MRHSDLSSFLDRQQGKAGPVALVLAEDEVELDSTLTHLVKCGFSHVVLLAPDGVRIAEGLEQTVHVVRHDVFAEGALVGAVNQVGPVVQVLPGVARCGSFADFLVGDQAWYDELTVELLRRGVFSLPGGRWYLSAAHTHADLDATVAAFGDAVAAVRTRVGAPADRTAAAHR